MWHNGGILFDALLASIVPHNILVTVAAAGAQKAAAAAPHVAQYALALIHICVNLHRQHRRSFRSSLGAEDGWIRADQVLTLREFHNIWLLIHAPANERSAGDIGLLLHMVQDQRRVQRQPSLSRSQTAIIHAERWMYQEYDRPKRMLHRHE